MVSGRRQAVDSFFIKANASLDSLAEKEIQEAVTTYGQELKANEDKKPVLRNVTGQNSQDDSFSKPKPAPSNDTHYSPGDPDAKMSVKPGKAIALNYLGQVAVDTATHMITHVQAFTSDKRDSECLTAVVRHVKDTLLENDVVLQEIIADTGYSSADWTFRDA